MIFSFDRKKPPRIIRGKTWKLNAPELILKILGQDKEAILKHL